MYSFLSFCLTGLVSRVNTTMTLTDGQTDGRMFSNAVECETDFENVFSTLDVYIIYLTETLSFHWSRVLHARVR